MTTKDPAHQAQGHDQKKHKEQDRGKRCKAMCYP